MENGDKTVLFLYLQQIKVITNASKYIIILITIIYYNLNIFFMQINSAAQYTLNCSMYIIYLYRNITVIVISVPIDLLSLVDK